MVQLSREDQLEVMGSHQLRLWLEASNEQGLSATKKHRFLDAVCDYQKQTGDVTNKSRAYADTGYVNPDFYAFGVRVVLTT